MVLQTPSSPRALGGTPVPGGRRSRGQGFLGACVLGCPSPTLPISQGEAASSPLRPPLPKATKKAPSCKGGHPKSGIESQGRVGDYLRRG